MANGDPIIIGLANTASNPGTTTSLSRDENTAETVFVARNLNIGDGIRGEASDDAYFGVKGINTIGTGVRGRSDDSAGVSGTSSSGTGVSGTSFFAGAPGVPGAPGVSGESTNGSGVEGRSAFSSGVRGTSFAGVAGAPGVSGESTSGSGVRGTSSSGNGVFGRTTLSNPSAAVVGQSDNGAGVLGQCFNASLTVAERRVGGLFFGGVMIINGLKPFTIDHPLDPENRYLMHTSVESSEMKNVYDGVARLDEDGAAWVDLPEWFEALNGDFRYQLTAVGGSAPHLHVAEEVSENRFKIAGGEEGMKVCWQLTGTRKDPWAAANPFEVEQEKPEEERGRYLDPSLYDAPEEQRVMIGPLAEAVEEEQRPPEPSGLDLARLEEEHRREMEELRQRMEERQEEAPPEST
jgi:hypothetical protein